MKKIIPTTPLVDEYLQLLQGMQPAETDSFFYTRLKAKMESQQPEKMRVLAPAFSLSVLTLLLIINCLLLIKPQKDIATSGASQSPIPAYGQVIGLNISTSY